YLNAFKKEIRLPESQPDTPQPDKSQDGAEPPRAEPPRTEYLPAEGLAGIVGGFVGGFFTLFGVAIASPAFRRFGRWGPTLTIATILGLLLTNQIGDWQFRWLILFLVWQPSVSASIARELARTREFSHSWP